MEYFKIRHTDDYTIKGEVLDSIKGHLTKNDEELYYEISLSLARAFEEFPSEDFLFPDMVMEKKALLIDILQQGNNFFIFNEKVFRVLKKFNLGKHKFYYPIYVWDWQKKTKRYFYRLESLHKYPHLSWEDSKYAYIDFDKTSFTSQTILGKDKEHLGLLSKEILMGLPRENKQGKSLYYTAETLHLTKEFTGLQLDLVTFYYLGIDWFCSERLKNAIEDAGITGFDIVETDKIITEE